MSNDLAPKLLMNTHRGRVYGTQIEVQGADKEKQGFNAHKDDSLGKQKRAHGITSLATCTDEALRRKSKQMAL